MDFKSSSEPRTMRFLFREGSEKFYSDCYSWEHARFVAELYNAVLIEKV